MAVEMLQKIWPEWQIEGEPLGKGSFGVVYKAVRRDHNVESFAAIKVISIPADPSEVDSLRSEGLDMNATRTYLQGIVNDFVSEIQLMESLKGVQNIVSVEDYKVVEKAGEIGWDIYIRMELLTPFNAYICDKKLTEEEVIKLGCDICTALEICGKRNIIHRDIKPENIFINDFGYFKLGDFGIARKMENMTGGLSQKGTFNYIAPEVANSSDYDARVDTYSLGIVLYRLLNGNRLPFLDTEKQLLNPNERRNAVDRRIRGEELPAPCDASPAMADLILRACAYDPNMRFASATEMKQALMSVANGTYQMAVSNLDRTTSVRKAPANYDKTTSVRKAPAASNQKSGQVVNTFGSTPKKNNLPKIIAAVLAVVVLIGAGIFAGPKLFDEDGESDGAEASTGTNEGTTSETTDYSKFDEEQIATIIADAEALASEEDYEGALLKVQAGLATYPDSVKLQNKADEYTAALNAQIKENTLAEAKSLADSGDYVSAIVLIKDAQENQGDDAEYQSAFKTYSSAYKTEVIASADALAANGDYISALEAVETATAIIGEDSELKGKADGYEDAYITEVINESNSLISENNFTEAAALIEAALKEFPENQRLIDQESAIQNAMPKNFMDACAPYEYENAEPITFVTMAGERYTNGFVQNYSSGGQILSNLGGKYAAVSFTVGHVDDTAMCDYQVEIYLDGVLCDTFMVTATEMPFDKTIPLTGAKQLMIVWGTDHRTYQDGCRIAFANIVVYPDSESDMEQGENTDTSSWDNFMDVCTPYEYDNAEAITTVMMAGERYANGFVQNYSSGGQAISNLGNKYTEMVFTVGHVDGTAMCNYEVEIYLDGVYYDSFDVAATGMPFDVTIPLSGKKQLMIKWSTDHRTYQDGCRIAFANIKIH